MAGRRHRLAMEQGKRSQVLSHGEHDSNILTASLVSSYRSG